MKRPKNLDMDKINRIFNEHFEFAKEDLEKGLTMWTLTPKRDNASFSVIDKQNNQELTNEQIITEINRDRANEWAEYTIADLKSNPKEVLDWLNEDFYKVEIKND